jgi:hypothetical protein
MRLRFYDRPHSMWGDHERQADSEDLNAATADASLPLSTRLAAMNRCYRRAYGEPIADEVSFAVDGSILRLNLAHQAFYERKS